MSKDSTALAEKDIQAYRLPRTAIPSKYEISLTPDLTKFTFAGEETIHLDIKQPVKEITLNAIEINIQKATVISTSGKEQTGKISLDEKLERATFSFDEAIPKGQAKLSIEFTGILNDKLHGFYRSTYKDEKGNEKVLATTQFEAADARRAFPCFDEPDFKAIFAVTLIVDEKLTAISNGAVKSENKLANGKKAVAFADTVIMSTYLVAFIVGEFIGTKEVMAGNVPIRVWAVPGKERLSIFALDIAQFSVNYFANYYGIPYPGTKMDLIAIPDFAFGAMENLGAITFRETALLVDEKTASHAEMERIADVVAHEIAHMWFGDLVTMKWWNGIWLNEAFATFAEMRAVDAWKPNWKRWDSFGVSRSSAFGVDGLKSTRPIEFPVLSPQDANGMFDVLTYEKGASVLRMLEQYLGAEVFQKGVSLYLNKHQFDNAETTDLWDGIEESCKQPVRQIMDSWIFQQGFPVITASVDESGKKLKLSQERFFYLKEAGNKQLFQVPVMLRAQTDKGAFNKKFILSEKETEIELPGKIEWVVINEGGHGFYRVAYSDQLMSALTSNLKADSPIRLAPIERFNLVNDTWALTVAGHIPVKQYLKMINMFKDENDKNVWAVIIGSLGYLNRTIADSDRPKLETFSRQLLSTIVGKLGFQPKSGEDELTKQLRGMAIGAQGTLGNDKDIQKQAGEWYAKYQKDKQAVDPNVVPALVSILAFAGDEARYEEFFNEFKNAKTPQDEQRYLFALVTFQNKDLLVKTLQKTLGNDIKSQNAPYLVQSALGNVAGRGAAWDFVKSNWKDILKRFPDNAIPRMVEGITSLVSHDWAKDTRKFFIDNPVKQGGKSIDQHLEKQDIAVAFKDRADKSIAADLS